MPKSALVGELIAFQGIARSLERLPLHGSRGQEGWEIELLGEAVGKAYAAAFDAFRRSRVADRPVDSMLPSISNPGPDEGGDFQEDDGRESLEAEDCHKDGDDRSDVATSILDEALAAGSFDYLLGIRCIPGKGFVMSESNPKNRFPLALDLPLLLANRIREVYGKRAAPRSAS
ncbi:hypothetical protein [Paludisphaera borealis]|uniref:Uncharacterized protein n=1 Tax=Paludisphaera borealis TaxID=1387353 RepID=A0A1U7CI90_9BACT|nr:hypothetical protein [Paludisphaera borealis]APW58654.1 hypothetical protein BSF38_00053 [Paludisphaera borealis]